MGPFSRLDPAAFDLNDSDLPLATRLAAAQRLGRFGPAPEAVATLLAVLAEDRAPPAPLLDAVLLALTRRAPRAAVPRLRALLKSAKRPATRDGIGRALAAIGTERSLAVLLDVIERPEAQRALLRAGPAAVPGLVEALRGEHAAEAAALLGEIGAQRARSALTTALRASAPEVRAAAARALGELAATEAAGPLLAALDDPQPRVADAALQALASVPAPNGVTRLLRGERSAAASDKPKWLRALYAADPARALAPLTDAARSDDPQLRTEVVALLTQSPDAAAVPLIAELATELATTGPEREALMSALARVPRGGGMRSLLELADEPRGRAAAARAIALGLRAHRDELATGIVDGGLRRLSALPAGARRLLLRALARDERVAPFAREALGSRDAALRSSAARALALLGDTSAGPVLEAQLRAERDPEAFRRQAEAAAALGVAPVLSAIWRRLDEPSTAAEAITLAAAVARGSAPLRLRTRLRRALSRAAAARIRAAAARALAQIDDRSATPALAAALLDPTPQVRLAAVRALGLLGGPDARAHLLGHARIERSERVRRAALSALSRRPAAVSEVGRRTLEVRILPTGDERPVATLVEVLLDDGRWLRIRTLSTGELLVPDLPEGRAEVRVVEGR